MTNFLAKVVLSAVICTAGGGLIAQVASEPPIASPPLTPVEDPAPDPVPEIKPILFRDVTSEQKRAANKLEKYLRTHGWTYDCNTPGGFYLWEREWEGKHYRMRPDDAAYVQSYIDLVLEQQALERQLQQSQGIQ